MRVPLTLLVFVQILGPAKERQTRDGNERYEEGKLDEALESYTGAQVDHPDAPELHYNIGNVQFRKKDFEKALEEYRTTSPEGSEVARRSSFNTGNVQYQAEKWEDAVTAYSDALRIDPSDVEARQNLELALQKLKQKQDQEQQQEQQPQPEGGGEGSSGEDSEETKSDKSPESENDQPDQAEAPKPNESTADESGAESEPVGMSPEEAEQILQALAQIEQAQQLEQQQKQKATAKGKGKYW